MGQGRGKGPWPLCSLHQASLYQHGRDLGWPGTVVTDREILGLVCNQILLDKMEEETPAWYSNCVRVHQASGWWGDTCQGTDWTSEWIHLCPSLQEGGPTWDGCFMHLTSCKEPLLVVQLLCRHLISAFPHLNATSGKPCESSLPSTLCTCVKGHYMLCGPISYPDCAVEVYIVCELQPNRKPEPEC